MQNMHFGLCNALSTYQRLIAGLLQRLINCIGFAYLDDVIAFSKTRLEHAADYRAVFDRIRFAN